MGAGANPHFYSLAAPNEYESILDVAVRWSHVEVVKYLLSEVSWPMRDIKHAYTIVSEEAEDNLIKTLLIQYSRQHFGRFYTFFAFSACACCCSPKMRITPLGNGVDSS